MNILGVDVPEKYVSNMMRRTDWTPEPISRLDDINPKWIGKRRYQVGPTYLRHHLWSGETEIHMLNLANELRHDAQRTADHELGVMESASVVSEYLLGELRALYIVLCRLANGRNA